MSYYNTYLPPLILLLCITMSAHVSQHITMHAHVSPCITMYAHVSPHITMSSHVSPLIIFYYYACQCI